MCSSDLKGAHTGRGFSVLICLYKPNSANASISVVISILFIFMMLFLICPCNSGFLPTLEQGVSTVYMCRRAHSATCSVSLDERSQAGLTDGSNVYSFPILHQACLFKKKKKFHIQGCIVPCKRYFYACSYLFFPAFAYLYFVRRHFEPIL